MRQLDDESLSRQSTHYLLVAAHPRHNYEEESLGNSYSSCFRVFYFCKAQHKCLKQISFNMPAAPLAKGRYHIDLLSKSTCGLAFDVATLSYLY
jgi:hypothetical protein